jgi:hypothetical protein
MRFLLKLRAYKRAFLGYCPRCNSDAPECDSCRVCANDRTWPQTSARMAYRLWIHFVEPEERN